MLENFGVIFLELPRSENSGKTNKVETVAYHEKLL